MVAGLAKVEEALAALETSLRPVDTAVVEIDDAVGRICAAAVVSRLLAPPFAVAAMDGYAVRWSDVDQPLVCLGTVKAGETERAIVRPGTCMRIFTGAPVPLGADTVVILELTDLVDDQVHVRPGAAAYRHIRAAGGNLLLGDPLVAAGRRLTARHVALLAAAGHDEIRVHRRPRIAVLSTGDELSAAFVADGAPQILDANRPGLMALVRAWGGVPIDLGIVPDAPEPLRHVVRVAASRGQADLLVTSGGASVGDFDLIAPTLAGLGFEAAFRSVAMRPGKATLFGTLGRLPVLGLPGNAVAAMIGAILFLRPAIALLSGAERPTLPSEAAVATTSLPATGPRTTYLRGSLERRAGRPPAFALMPDQDNARLSELARADAFVVRPADAPASAAGKVVEVIAFDRLEGF